MDKQQAAEAQTNKISWNDFSDLAQMVYVQALVKDATIAGWEALEAQCPGDAIALLKQIPQQMVDAANGITDYGFLQEVNDFINAYKANPSGAAPQTEGPVWVDKSRRQWMRKEAITIFELTKGYTPEQRALFDNAMKGMEDMAGHVLELTNEPESGPQVFTREQVDAMLKDTIRHFNSIYGLPPADAAYVDKWIEGTLTECLDTNYSPLNK